MDKQTLIEMANTEKDRWSSSGSEYEKGRHASMKVAINGMERLDEPVAVVVPVLPRYVANYLDTQKRDPDRLIGGVYLEMIENQALVDVLDWCEASVANSNSFAEAWLHSYRTEEPLYRIILLDLDSERTYGYLDKEGCADFTNNMVNVTSYGAQLTEREIKKKFPKYWAFAEPVDKERKTQYE